MKSIKNMRLIRGRLSNSSIAIVVNMLEHRPNIWDGARNSFNEHEYLSEAKPHYIYSRGFYEGYQYAIKRLKKQIK